MKVFADLAILEALYSSRDAAYDPHLVAAKSKPPALDTGELQS